MRQCAAASAAVTGRQRAGTPAVAAVASLASATTGLSGFGSARAAAARASGAGALPAGALLRSSLASGVRSFTSLSLNRPLPSSFAAVSSAGLPRGSPWQLQSASARWHSTDAHEQGQHAPQASEDEPRVHIVKLIARAGVASRRAALSLVQSGRVLVDGVALTGAGANYLIRASSRVTIDGKPFLDPAGAAAAAASGTAAVPRAADEFSEHGSAVNNTALRVPTHLPRPRVWLYYKPVGLIVSHKDDAAARAGPGHARRTIFEQLDEDYFAAEAAKAEGAAAGQQPMTVDRLLSVGRLDYLSEGLMVLTNSGALQRFMEHPSSGFARAYRIKVDGVLSPAQEAELQAGANVEGFKFKPCKITRLTNAAVTGGSESAAAPSEHARTTWYEVVLHEGKNRELRALLNHCGRSILKLVRVSFHSWGLDMAHMAWVASGAATDDAHVPLNQRTVRVSNEPAGGRQQQQQLKRSMYALVPGQMVEIEWPAMLEQRRRQWNAEQQQLLQARRSTPAPSSMQRSLRSGAGAPGVVDSPSARVASMSMLAGSGVRPLHDGGVRHFSTNHTPFRTDSPASAFLSRRKDGSAPAAETPAAAAAAKTDSHAAPAKAANPLPSHIHSATCGCPGHGGKDAAEDSSSHEQGSEAFLAGLDRAISAHKAVSETLVDPETLARVKASAAPATTGAAAESDSHFVTDSAANASKWTLASMLSYNHAFVKNKDYIPYLTDRFPYKKLVVVTCMDARLTELLPMALDLKNGDAKVIKVAGAMVAHPFGSVMRSILVAVYALGAEHILVIGHHDCGMTGMNPSLVLQQAKQRGVPDATFKTLSSAGLNLEGWLSGFQSVRDSVLHSVDTIRNHPLLNFQETTVNKASQQQQQQQILETEASAAAEQQPSASSSPALASVARTRLPRITVTGLVICPTTGRLDLVTETDPATQALVDRQSAELDAIMEAEGGLSAEIAAARAVGCT